MLVQKVRRERFRIEGVGLCKHFKGNGISKLRPLTFKATLEKGEASNLYRPKGESEILNEADATAGGNFANVRVQGAGAWDLGARR